MKQRKRELHCKAIALMFALWFAISWLQIIKDNSTGCGAEPSWWNMFCVLGCIDANASEHLADYEANKGISKAKYMQDLDLLSRVIYSEGGGASWVSDDMCYGIGSVVLNRVEHKDFPNSIKEVVYQSGQYACINTRYFFEQPNERSLEIAEELLNGSENRFPKDVVFQAQFTQGSGVYSHIQNMYFCYR